MGKSLYKAGVSVVVLAAMPLLIAATGRGEQQAPAVEMTAGMLARTGELIDPENHPGKALYQAHCSTCHDGGMPRAPHRDFLQMLSGESILTAMNLGSMVEMAAGLKPEERQQVAKYLTRTKLGTQPQITPVKMCEGPATAFDLEKSPAELGWGYDPTRFVPAEVAKLTPADIPKLKVKWAFAFPGATRARSQPVVAMGAAFVGSQDGTVYALDLASGCARWKSKVAGEVRTGIVVEPWSTKTAPKRDPRLFFGDILGNLYALNALNGEVLWRVRVDEHSNSTLTATPTFHDGKLYVPVSSLEPITAAEPSYSCCTFRGSVAAVDPETGQIEWRHYSIPNPPSPQHTLPSGSQVLGPSGAPVWTSPFIDKKRGVLYHGSGENYSSPADENSDAVFAVDLKTGGRLWQQQGTAGDAWNAACTFPDKTNCPKENGPDFDLSASPLLIDIGKNRQAVIAGYKSGEVVAYDPDKKGKVIWRNQVGSGGIHGGVHFGMAAEGSRVYVPMVDLLWGNAGESLESRGAPGLHALDGRTGRTLWSALEDPALCRGRRFCDPGMSSAATAIPGVVFAGSLNGWMRAFDGATGKTLWSYDTTTPIKTISGEVAQGGSMSGPGPTIQDGYVLLNSGYGIYFHMPGNVLLAFTVDGK